MKLNDYFKCDGGAVAKAAKLFLKHLLNEAGRALEFSVDVTAAVADRNTKAEASTVTSLEKLFTNEKFNSWVNYIM